MKFYLAEMEAKEAVDEAKTLEDFVMIGFSHVEYIAKNKERYFCYEMMGDHEVEAYPMNREEPMIEKIDGTTEAKFVCYDRDADGYTTIVVEEA